MHVDLTQYETEYTLSLVYPLPYAKVLKVLLVIVDVTNLELVL